VSRTAAENLDRLIELILNHIDDDLRTKGYAQHGGFQAMKANLNSENPKPPKMLFDTQLHSKFGDTKPLWAVKTSFLDVFRGPPAPAPVASFQYEFIANLNQLGNGAVSLEFSENVNHGSNHYRAVISLRFTLEKLNVVSPKVHFDRASHGLTPILIDCPHTKLSQANCQCLICGARRCAMTTWGYDV
jgi:hypothetical protein